MAVTLVTVSLCLTLFLGAHAEVAEKIVGGMTATITEFPFQVSLRQNNAHFCGGSIIGERHILTAAHCVRNYMKPPYNGITVVTGSTMSYGSSGVAHRIARADVHPAYTGTDTASFRHDIAVITLSDRIIFNNNQRKINLPNSDVQFNQPAMVSGWGMQAYPRGNLAPSLMKASTSILPMPACAPKMDSRQILFNDQVCAKQKYGVGTCLGDSGGPLSSNNQIIGVVSWLIPCGRGFPDVYAKVYAYKKWIEGIMAST